MGEGRGDTDLYADAGARIMELYRQRIDGRSKTGEEGALARRIDERSSASFVSPGFAPSEPNSIASRGRGNYQTRSLASWSEKSICSRRASVRDDEIISVSRRCPAA
jgi:hypothetical protein